MSRYYYLVSSLPSLPPLGERPPLRLSELRALARDSEGLGPIVDLVLLEDDLLQRQALLAGETDRIATAVLSEEQARGEEPLPTYLQAGDDSGAPVGDDPVWEAYFRHVDRVAGRLGSGFLRRWVAFEVGLRNRLVEARAKSLRLSAEEYLVAPELGEDSGDTAALVERWQAADNPLEAQRVLDQGRFEWLAEHGAWFEFTADEVAAYARGLLLLTRWDRMKQATQPEAA